MQQCYCWIIKSQFNITDKLTETRRMHLTYSDYLETHTPSFIEHDNWDG